MARLFGVDLPREKKVGVGLRYLYGIGPTLADRVVKATGIDANTRVRDLTEEQVGKLTSYIQTTFKIEGDLRREVQGNIKRLVDISSYRGIRHRRNLPVNGQRTHTNARTRKGPRKISVGTRKKPV
jgi:small subunit ribosomal protein S13